MPNGLASCSPAFAEPLEHHPKHLHTKREPQRGSVHRPRGMTSYFGLQLRLQGGAELQLPDDLSVLHAAGQTQLLEPNGNEFVEEELAGPR